MDGEGKKCYVLNASRTFAIAAKLLLVNNERVTSLPSSAFSVNLRKTSVPRDRSPSIVLRFHFLVWRLLRTFDFYYFLVLFRLKWSQIALSRTENAKDSYDLVRSAAKRNQGRCDISRSGRTGVRRSRCAAMFFILNFRQIPSFSITEILLCSIFSSFSSNSKKSPQKPDEKLE